jgi:hypothetical protein
VLTVVLSYSLYHLCANTPRGARLADKTRQALACEQRRTQARIFSCTLGATVTSLRRYALSRWCCHGPHLCTSDYGLGWWSISTQCSSGSDLSATEYIQNAGGFQSIEQCLGDDLSYAPRYQRAIVREDKATYGTSDDDISF